MSTLTLGATVETVRIPELPANDIPLGLSDKLPVYVQSANKTRHIPLSVLKTFIISGSTEVLTPKPIGNSFVVKAGVSEAGTKIFNIPAISGQLFFLRRGFAAPMEIGVDYDCLTTGGFKLLGTDDRIELNEKFEIQIATPTTIGGGATGSGLIFDGEISVSANTTLNQSSHLKKLVRARPTAVGLIIKLAKVEEYPENEIVCIEAVINAPHETTIQTQAGQNIYFNGQSLQEMVLRQGDSLILQRSSTGWYVLYASPSLYNVGDLDFGYKLKANQLLCIGQELSRSAYKRIWNWVEGLSDSLVDDATWNTASATVAGRTVEYPYRGCFSTGDGASTFRLPDWRNMALRTLNNIGGTDTERHYNKPGGLQWDEYKETDLILPLRKSNNNYGLGSSNGPIIDLSNLTLNEKISNGGGSESRMKNIGVIAKICI